MRLVEVKTYFSPMRTEEIITTYLIPLNQISYVYSRSDGVDTDYCVVFNKDEELEIDKDKFLEIKKLLESEDKDI